MMNEIPMDEVTLSFIVEEWIDSDTAKVTIDITAAIEGKDGPSVRDEIKESLEKLFSGDWRFVRLDRRIDAAGMEQWTASAQIRVPEKDLNNVAGQAKALSRVGLQLRIGNVDYTPTRAQFEALNRELRSRLNTMIKDEIAAIRNELPGGRNWRVGTVHYGDHQSFSNVRGGQIMAMSANATPQTTDFDDVGAYGESGGGFDISQKVTMTATVSVSSTVPGVS